MLLSNENGMIRVLQTKGNRSLVIDCIKRTMPKWIATEDIAAYTECSETELYDRTGMIQDRELTQNEQRIAQEHFTMIAGVLTFIGNEPKRNQMIELLSEHQSKQTIRKYLCLYLVYQNLAALAPIKRAESKELTQDEKNMRWGLNKFFYTQHKNSLNTAYTLMLQAKYCDAQGQLAAEYPSFNQFRYFYRKTKAAGKFAAKKVVAGVLAASVAVGGTAVALSSNSEPTSWYGYGEEFHTSASPRRFDMTIDKMNNSHISGHLEVSELYEIQHETDFEGSGTKEDGKIVYEVTFDTPRVTTLPENEFTEITIEYDKEANELQLDGIYEAVLNLSDDKEEEEILFQETHWYGIGEDNFYNGLASKNHYFILSISDMTMSTINGKLLVNYYGRENHESLFTGRGYGENGYINYEIKLDIPRTESGITTTTVDNFWLRYCVETQTFEISGMYDVIMGQADPTSLRIPYAELNSNNIPLQIGMGTNYGEHPCDEELFADGEALAMQLNAFVKLSLIVPVSLLWTISPGMVESSS